MLVYSCDQCQAPKPAGDFYAVGWIKVNAGSANELSFCGWQHVVDYAAGMGVTAS